ncbi:MAG: hypothetical protein GY915_05235 [bacterium]|nr:hypothetical protein [bacterium]
MAQKVEFPGRRHEMILQIKDLSDFEMQKEKWVNPKAKHAFWDNMRFPIEALLDEWDLENESEGNIGWILRNKKEAEITQKASKALGRIIDEVGIEKPDVTYLNSPFWQEVVQAAKAAYEVLMKDEDLEDLLRQEKARIVD